jgi:acetyl esterase/lipase
VDFMKPLVLPVPLRTPDRNGRLDLYLPDDLTAPRPAILFVHGGPVPADLQPGPRDWPMFQGYGSLAANRGVVGAVVGHRLHSPAAYPDAAEDVAAAVDALRRDSRVDGERLALWFFSGGGLLAADWLRKPPSWLRVLAFSYPLVAALPGWPVPERFAPIEAAAGVGDVPIVLTRAGREDPAVAALVEQFVAVAHPQIVDVPEGRHSFDVLDDDDASRAAVTRATDLVLAALR